MGGDRAPEACVQAAVRVVRTTRIAVRLFGDKQRLDPLLARAADTAGDRELASRLEVVHAPDSVRMDESPREAVRRPDTSIARAAEAVAAGRAEALVSAGNTGAVLLHAARAIPRLPGVRRAALAAVYPTRPRPHNPDPFALLLDVGANLRCAPEDLVQFATMGSAYASRISKVERPTVGLLNIGAEAGKGDALLREAHALLAGTPGLAFHGNVEGVDVPAGVVDVVVCPGVLGNVTLKLLEGMGELVLALGEDVFRRRPHWRLGRALLGGGLRRLADLMDYAAYGGAPILGFERIVIKAHGRSDARALENALKVAAKAVRDDVCGAIAAALPGSNP